MLTPTVSLRAQFLGQYKLFQDDIPVEFPAAVGARLLLAYLVLHPGQAYPRSVLAEMLAPNQPEPRARHALSHALWHIRRCLPGLIEGRDEEIQISTLISVQVDALEFKTLAGRGLARQGIKLRSPQAVLADLSEAAELYHGDLLEGHYEDWILAEREWLREQYLQVLEGLILALKATLRYEQALNVALRLVNADPLRESAHREGMRLYHYLGRPAAALKQFETCKEVINRELGLEVEPETQSLAQAISRHAAPESVTYLPDPHPAAAGSFLGNQTHNSLPLFGRSVEREQLVSWLRTPVSDERCSVPPLTGLPGEAGTGSLVLLEGEAGIGKTRLLQETARDAEWLGCQVLWGKARPFGAARPLGALIEALESGLTPLRVEQLQHLVEPLWLQALQPVLPLLLESLAPREPLPALEAGHAKKRLQEGLARLLIAWARISPLVVIIEDIHWSDADTQEMLLQLPAYLEGSGVVLLLSYRGEEIQAQPGLKGNLSALRLTVLRGRLSLNGLDEQAARQLIHASLGAGAPAPAFAARLYEQTSGNPLFILETLRGLYDEGVLRQGSDGNWNTPYDSQMEETELPLPPAIEQVILRRLEQLPPDLRVLIEVPSVLGSPFSYEQLVCLNLAEPLTWVSAMQEFVKRRLLVETPQAYQFRHDKIRQVIYDSLEPARRQALHTAVGRALETASLGQLDNLAYHFTRGQVWPQAMHYHQQAAQQAMNTNAYAIALRHLNDALACAEQAQVTAEERFNLLEMRVEVVSILGDPQQIKRDLDLMAQLAGDNPAQRSRLDPLQLHFLVSTGHYAEAETTAHQVLSWAESQGNLSLQAAALVTLGSVFDIAGDKQQALTCLQGAVDRYQQIGDRHGEAEARSHLANVLAKTEQRASARREFETGLALFEALGDRPKCADLLAVLGVLSNYDGALEDSLQYYHRSLEISRSIGYRIGEVYASHGLGQVLLALGQVGQAIHTLQDTLNICHAVGDPRLECFLRVHLASIYTTYVGNYSAATQEAAAGLALARAIGERVLEGICLNELGETLLGFGKLEEARQHMESALEIQLAAHNDLKVFDIYESMVWLELACGDAEAAQRNLELAQALYKQFNITYAAGSLLSLRAECLLACGRAEEAIACAQQAIAHAEGKKTPYRVFYTLYKTLNALERTTEARQALEQAYQGLVDMVSSLTPEDQKMSCEQVPVHRAILKAWQKSHPRRISVRLPRAGTPLGRPLKPEEWVEVNWTVAAEEDEAIGGKVARRRARLLRLLEEAAQQGASPAYEHLAQALGVSPRTLSTDMAALQGEAAARLKATLRGRPGK